MKLFISILFMALGFSKLAIAGDLTALKQHRWYAGGKDCSDGVKAAPIEIYQFDIDTYILRQNKCLHYEAPFLYLLFGTEKALLVDTGAMEDVNAFPLFDTVNNIQKQRARVLGLEVLELPLIVAHSHSHGDHIAGDGQFNHAKNVTLVPAKDLPGLKRAFGIKNWPEQEVKIELGQRELTLIPSPGHQNEAVTFYDTKNKWLITGDNLYPGRLYVRKWQIFKQSITTLVEFSKHHEIKAILRAHIEMSNINGVDYKMGSTYHPNEASLVLSKDHLLALHTELKNLGDKPTKVVKDKFIIYPL